MKFSLLKKIRDRRRKEEPDGPVDVTLDMDFGELRVCDSEYDGEPVRMLLVDGTQESATYMEPWRRYELVFPYTRAVAETFGDPMGEHPRRVLLIGGAGFSLAKYYIANFPDGVMDVAEMYREMADTAGKYFYLDQLRREFDTDRTGRLNIHIGDAYAYLEEYDGEPYDLIINDAYVGNVMDRGLASDKGVGLIHRALAEDGIYCLNIITAMEGYLAMTGLLEREIIERHFTKVGMFQVNPERNPEHRQNCLIIGER